MTSCFSEKHNTITSITSILSILIGFFGFLFTIYQINQTQTALKSSNSYTIQRDARDIFKNNHKNGLIDKIILDEKLTEIEIKLLKKDLWITFNFYLSVYRQKQSGGIDENFSAYFSEDFCEFLKIETKSGKKPIMSMWDLMISNRNLSKNYEEMRGDWCE